MWRKKFSQVSDISKENAADLKAFRLVRAWISQCLKKAVSVLCKLCVCRGYNRTAVAAREGALIPLNSNWSEQPDSGKIWRTIFGAFTS
jgi:hypothetical protein